MPQSPPAAPPRSPLGALRAAILHPLETAICALLLGLTATVFAQVLARYVFAAPLSWSEELARFLLMWLSMLSAAYAFRSGSHFALTFVVDRLPAGLRRAVALLVHLVVAAFFAFLFWYALVFLWGVEGHRAPAMQIPMEIPHSAVAAGAALMCLEALRSLWRTWRAERADTPRLPPRSG